MPNLVAYSPQSPSALNSACGSSVSALRAIVKWGKTKCKWAIRNSNFRVTYALPLLQRSFQPLRHVLRVAAPVLCCISLPLTPRP